MFFKSLLLSAVAVSGVIVCGTAHAETINQKVSAGKTSLVYRFTIFNRATCGSMGFSKASLKQPKNGRLSSRRVRIRSNLSGRCKGRLVNAIAVYYTPNRGFRGSEKVKFGFNYPRFVDGSGHNYKSIRGNLQVR